jgi:hypothetical protein
MAIEMFAICDETSAGTLPPASPSFNFQGAPSTERD